MEEISQLIETFNQKEVEISRLQHASYVLYVDLQSICPSLGQEARAEQLTTLSGIIHEKITDSSFVNLITSIRNHPNFNVQREDIVRKIELWYKEITINTALSKEFVQHVESLKSQTNNLWRKARETLQKEDKEQYLDSLNELFNARLEEFERVKEVLPYSSPYEYYVDLYEENMTPKHIDSLFSQIKKGVIEIVNQVDTGENPISQNSLKTLEQLHLPSSSQEELLLKVFEYLGLDSSFFKHFETTHPFMISLGPKEVRVGIAYREDPFFSFSSGIHEAGHALYEHNQEYKDTILGQGSSTAIHESQSLFWESHISTSNSFLSSFYKEFQKVSNNELDNISFEEFYAYVNRVSKSLIRIEGDELTYPLHIIIRFEIEKELFAQNITVYDIERVWNEKYREYFNREPENFKEGFMQDVHWSEGIFGYFPTYLLGRIYASQIEKELRKRFSNYDDIVSSYQFETILKVLREEILKFGKLKTNSELITNFVGEECNPEVYIEYLKEKFDSIYNFK
ncbi:MAG: hypothetical protein ACMXYB_04015 [Candidatus Woesearchaeota archaeon]